MADVFISYSRSDSEFVRLLHDLLIEKGLDVWGDWDIPAAADWMPEIGAAIESADNFLFVISPESVSSEVCRRERQHALDHCKRLIPILRRQTEMAAVPKELAALNWVFFREEDNPDESLRRILTAIETDLPWVREHTRLLVRALEWDRKKEDESLLLRGEDLRGAESWFAHASLKKEPTPNSLHVRYLQASQALRERERQEALAMQLAKEAELTRKQEARLLPRSVLLALESMHRFRTAEGYRALRNGVALLPRPVGKIQHRDRVLTIAFSPDGRWMASGSADGAVRIWDVAGQRDVASMSHNLRVSMVRFAPDGQRIATASEDQTVCIWEAATGRQLALMHAGAPALSVEFSRDGRWLLAATGLELGPDVAAPGVARVWDTDSGREAARVPHSHLTGLFFLPFLADGFWVASATDNRRMLLWEATTGEYAGEIQLEDIAVAMACHPTKPILATSSLDMKLVLWDLAGEGGRRATIELGSRNSPVVFSSQGRWLASVTGDHKVRVWETDSLSEVAQIPHEGEVTALSFSPDEQLLATVSHWRGILQLWELRTGKEIARTAQDQAYCAAFSSNGRWLGSASDDSAAWVWETAGSGDAIWISSRSGKSGVAIFSPDGGRVAVGATTYQTATGWISSRSNLQGMLRLLDATSGREIISIPHSSPIEKLEFSSDGRRVASLTWEQACVWDATDGRQVSRMQSGTGTNDLAFSPDGLRVVTVSDDGSACVWEVETGLEIARIEHGTRLFAVAFSPDGQWIAFASDDGTTRICEVATSREVSRITHPKVPVWQRSFRFAFSPSGQWLTSPGAENTAGVWEAATGREMARMVHQHAVIALALSRSGERVVTAAAASIGGHSNPGEVRVWEPTTGIKIGEKWLESAACAVAFSPDGQWVAAGLGNGGILVWEVQTGHELALLQHEKSITSVAFSPDGRLLASASQDETVRAWLWRAEDLMDEACARLTRNLTPEEWQQYLGEEKFRKTCQSLL